MRQWFLSFFESQIFEETEGSQLNYCLPQQSFAGDF